MEEEKYDVIFTDFANTSIYGYILAKRFGVPWVYSSHNIEYRRFLELGKIDFKRYPFVPFMYLVERLGAMADIITVISENDAKVFRKWVPENRVIVILQGFNEEVFNPYYEEPKTSRPIVLFYGSLTHLPNRQAAFTIVKEILPKVIERIPNVLFQFVGANPPKELIHPNTELTGFVDNLVDYIHQATLTIAPLTLGEGMRTKIVESLACGKVVISTDKGAAGISRKYKNLIIKEIEEFPEAICEVINNRKPIDDKDFESLKQEFSWNRNVLKLKQKIDEVIGA
jgi:glycosyltransferase involved in cell wall biosynthesis